MEFLVLVGPDFLTSLLYIHSREITSYVHKSPQRHQVGLDAHRRLAPCQCGSPQDLSGEINLLVAMPRPWLLFMFSLGQNQPVLLTALLLSSTLQDDRHTAPLIV